jgi:hypothetical protein
VSPFSLLVCSFLLLLTIHRSIDRGVCTYALHVYMDHPRMRSFGAGRHGTDGTRRDGRIAELTPRRSSRHELDDHTCDHAHVLVTCVTSHHPSHPLRPPPQPSSTTLALVLLAAGRCVLQDCVRCDGGACGISILMSCITRRRPRPARRDHRRTTEWEQEDSNSLALVESATRDARQ